jgi:hypothetical protein
MAFSLQNAAVVDWNGMFSRGLRQTPKISKYRDSQNQKRYF